MEFHKIIPQQTQDFIHFRTYKPVLGVIHPTHPKVVKQEPNQDYSDLFIESRQQQLQYRDVQIAQIPQSLVNPRQSQSKSPMRAKPLPLPKSSRPQTWKEKEQVKDIANQVLHAIPFLLQKNKAVKKLTLLTPKDFRTTLQEFEQVEKQYDKTLVRHKASLESWKDLFQKARIAFNQAFESGKIDQDLYSETRPIVEQLDFEFRQIIWKEKQLIQILKQPRGQNFNIKAIENTITQEQIKEEDKLLLIQKFILGLKADLKRKFPIGERSLRTNIDDLGQFLNSFSTNLDGEQRITMIYYLEKIRKSIKRGQENIPIDLLDDILDHYFNKSERRFLYLHNFIQDMKSQRDKEIKYNTSAISSKRKERIHSLERKLVLEFIMKYLAVLDQGVIKREQILEDFDYKAKYGTAKPKTWKDVIVSARDKAKELEIRQAQEQLTRKIDVSKVTRKRPSTVQTRSSRVQRKRSVEKAEPKNNEIDNVIGLLSKPQQPQQIQEQVQKKLKLISHNIITAFQSINAAIPKKVRFGNDPIHQKLQQIKNQRDQMELEKSKISRNDLITDHQFPFHPYLDEYGRIFKPEKQFKDSPPPPKDIIPTDQIPIQIQHRPSNSQDWAIRPHHLTSITNHPFSIPDYVIPIQKDKAAEEPKDPFGPPQTRDYLIRHLEQVVSDLKCDLENRQQKAYTVADEALRNPYVGYDIKVSDPIQFDKWNDTEQLTYESILEELRRRERELLNVKRQMLYEEHRPPRERWYELKTSDFNKELHRNVMENRPNDQNRKFLNKVVIKELY